MDTHKINELLQNGKTNTVIDFFQSQQFNNIRDIIDNMSSFMDNAIKSGDIALVRTLLPLMTTSANANNLILHPKEESYSNNEHLLKMRSLDMCFQKALSHQQYDLATVLIDEMIPHLASSYTVYNGSLVSLMQLVSSYGNLKVFEKMDSAVSSVRKLNKEETVNCLYSALSNNNAEIVEHLLKNKKVGIEYAMRDYVYHSEAIQQFLLKPEFGVLQNKNIDKSFLLNEAVEKCDLQLVESLINSKEIVPPITPDDDIFYRLQRLVNQRPALDDNKKILELVDYMLTSKKFTPPKDIHELLLFGAGYHNNVELVDYLLTSTKLKNLSALTIKDNFLNTITCSPAYDVVDYVFNNASLVNKISKSDMKTCFINAISEIYHSENGYENRLRNVERAKTIYELALSAKVINKIDPTVALQAIRNADHYMIDFLMNLDQFKPYILEHSKYMVGHALTNKNAEALQYFMDTPEFNGTHGWQKAITNYTYSFAAREYEKDNTSTEKMLNTLKVLVQNKPQLSSKVKQYFEDNADPDTAALVSNYLDNGSETSKKAKP